MQLYLIWQSLVMWILYAIGRQRVSDSVMRAHPKRKAFHMHASISLACKSRALFTRPFQEELALDTTWLADCWLACCSGNKRLRQWPIYQLRVCSLHQFGIHALFAMHNQRPNAARTLY